MYLSNILLDLIDPTDTAPGVTFLIRTIIIFSHAVFRYCIHLELLHSLLDFDLGNLAYHNRIIASSHYYMYFSFSSMIGV